MVQAEREVVRGRVSLVEEAFCVRETGCSWYGGVHGGPSGCGCVVVVRGGSRRFVVRGGPFVVVVVGETACVCAESTRGPSPSLQESLPKDEREPTEPREVPFPFSFHLGFCVCVCREASSAK